MKKKLLILLTLLLALAGVLKVNAKDAYAVQSDDKRTLTFYYNSFPPVFNSAYYVSSNNTDPSWSSLFYEVNTVVFDSSFADYRPTTCYKWFNNFYNLTTIQGLENLNTSNVTNMNFMFRGCERLENINVSGFNTDNVTDMEGMFARCSAVQYLSVNYFNTANVTNMASMFSGCSSLQKINLRNHDMTKVYSMYAMFDGCTQLAEVDFSGVTMENVTDMGNMFDGCSSLKTVDLSGFNTANVTNMKSMFNNCTRLTNLDVSGFNTANVTDMSYMFSSCSNLNSLDVSRFNTSKVTDMNSMFQGCYELLNLDVTGFNTAKVTDMGNMFGNCSYLRGLNVTGFNTAMVTNMNYMFYGCFRLPNLDVGNFTFRSGVSTSNMFSDCRDLTSLSIPATANNLSADACTNVGTETEACVLLYPNGFTPDVASSGSNWYRWKSGYFKDLAVEPYAVRSVDRKELTFYNDSTFLSRNGTVFLLNTGSNSPGWYNFAEQLERVTFDPSFADVHPTTLYFWFADCSNLESITGIEYLNTDNATNMSCMFFGCSKLTSIDLSRFNTAKVVEMTNMFGCCSSLRSLDVSSFSTTHTFNIDMMFKNCSSLTTLDLSGFSISHLIRSPEEVLSGCSGLKQLSLFADANDLDDEALTGVGTQSSPCTLIYPEGFTPEPIDIGNGWYKWKGGYFVNEAQPYALLYNNTLVFYYDGQGLFRNGTLYNLNTGSNDPGWLNNSTIANVVFHTSFANARPTSCYKWFWGRSNLTFISGIENLKTDEVTNMHGMFGGCSGLEVANVSRFNTANVTDMGFMFYNCSGLQGLDVSGFNTANVTDMQRMFCNCSNLPYLDVSGFNTANVAGFKEMFKNCSRLLSIDVSGFNTANAYNMAGMFHGCSSLKSLDLGSFEFNDGAVFSDETQSGSAPLNFVRCSSLETLVIPATANNLSSCAFAGTGSQSAPCAIAYPASFAPQNVTEYENYFKWKEGYFKYVTQPYVVLSGNTLTFYYDDKKASRTGYVYDLNTDGNLPGWSANAASITTVEINKTFVNAKPTTCYNWFAGMTRLTSFLGVDYLNTSEVTNMMNMFYNCSSIAGIHLNYFNTAKVTNMANMFAGCSNSRSFYVFSFNTSKVTNMDSMFKGCSSLESINISNFNTAKVQNMNNMFYGCSKLVNLDLRNFTFANSEGVTSTSQILNGCSGLRTLYIPETANDLDASALSGVGTQSVPCTLVYNADFTPQDSTQYDGYFIWKNGYFKDVAPDSYAVLNGSTLTFYCDIKKAIRQGAVYDLNTGSVMPGWYGDRTSITNVVFDSSFTKARPTSCFRWFSGMTNLTAIEGIDNLNTSKVTNMSAMFSHCSQLSSIDVGNFNTANVVDMSSMFQNCSFTSIDVSNFNTSQVTIMGGMFANNANLQNLDISNFVIPDSTSTYGIATIILFSNCSSLKCLALPATAKNISHNSCLGVGTQADPCTLIYPAGFTPQTTATGDGWFQWKSGYFKKPDAPYAVLDGNILSFYCDARRDSRSGDTYDLNTGWNLPAWLSSSASSVTKVVFDNSFVAARPTSCFGWFQGMTNLTEIIGINNLKTVDVTNMGQMFYGCSSLESVDVSGFNTSNVTDMTAMFMGCSSLTDLDVSGFDTGNVNTFNYTFAQCSSLRSLDVSGFDTGNVHNMAQMFSYCTRLDSLDVSGFNTDKVISMASMFEKCSSLSAIDVSGFNTANLISMERMFSSCSSLTSLDVSGFDTGNVTNMDFMFYGCHNLTSLDLSGFNTSKLSNINSMLSYCYALQTLAIPATADIFNANACQGIGSQANPCTLIYPDGFTLQTSATGDGWFKWKSGYFKDLPREAYALLSSDNTTLTFYCDFYRATRTGTTYSLNTGNNSPGWYSIAANITNVGFDASFIYARPTSCYRWFCRMANIDNIAGLQYLNTSEVTNMKNMFGNCSSLTDIDVSGFITDNVTDISNLFYYCSSLTSVDVSGFNTDNVTDMRAMFAYCPSLTAIDVSGFNTSNVTLINSMFDGCSNLSSIDVSGFNTERVTQMNYMFKDCSSLTGLDVSGFNTERVTQMLGMFRGCSSLTSLDISSFTFNTYNTVGMFNGCTALQTLVIPLTADLLHNLSCNGVGTQAAPCKLVFPLGFTPEKTEEGEDWYKWKDGFFFSDLMGDANGDGEVSISDIVMVVDYILGKNPQGFVFENALMNDDNEVSIVDINYIVDIVLNHVSGHIPAKARESIADKLAMTAKGNRCTLHLVNSEPCMGMSFTVTMPEGAEMGNVALASNRTDGHQALVKKVGEGRYNVVVYSGSGKALRDDTAAMMHFDIKGCDSDEIIISGIQMVNNWLETILLPSVYGVTDGIVEIGGEGSDGNSPYYNTMGAKTYSPIRGVYIQNGNKIVVK